jgi:uroporphyrin-3 C-methyltransferase
VIEPAPTAAAADTPAALDLAPSAAGAAPPPASNAALPGHIGWIALAVVGALSVAAVTLALLGQQRVKSLEQELVRRQQDSQSQAIEARALAKQASPRPHCSAANSKT